MRGKRAKRLRTEERPNPGRKGGGATKAEVKERSGQLTQKSAWLKALQRKGIR